MSQSLAMRNYINCVELSYKQNLESSTMLTEAVSWDAVKNALTGILKPLKTPGKLVFQLLVGLAMFGFRNPIKTGTGAILASTGLLVPLYNLIKELLHRGAKIPTILEKLKNLELKATKVDLYMKQFEIVTPAQFQEYLQGAQKIIQKDLASPDGGWLSAGLKNIAGVNSPTEQLANAIYHVGVELGLPATLSTVFVSWLYGKLKQQKQQLMLQDMQKLMQTYPQLVATLQQEVQELRQELEIVKSAGKSATQTSDTNNAVNPATNAPRSTNEMRYFINQIAI